VLLHVEGVDAEFLLLDFPEFLDDHPIGDVFQLSHLAGSVGESVVDGDLDFAAAVDCETEGAALNWEEVFVIAPVLESLPGMLLRLSCLVTHKLLKSPRGQRNVANARVSLFEQFFELAHIHLLAIPSVEEQVNFIQL